jgi:hypothetical protein
MPGSPTSVWQSGPDSPSTPEALELGPLSLSIQPPSNKSSAPGFQYFELLDRKLDRRLRIGLIVDDANELNSASRGGLSIARSAPPAQE